MMAHGAGPSGGKLNFLSLTGPLNLYQKGRGLFKGQYKRYWFWFDEQTCCLKYYKSQQTYSQSVREPLGVIDLRYAKVTPALTASGSSGGSKANNVFHINIDKEMYQLAAADNESAINWIEKLQEKRSEFIIATSAQLEANQELEQRRTLSVLTKPVGALATSDATQEVDFESPTVRNIFKTNLQGDGTGRLGVAVHLDALQLPGNRSDGLRRSTVSYCPIGSTTYDQNPVEQTPSDSTLSVDGEDTSQQNVLQPHERAQIALEACYLESQNKAFRLQKEVLHLKEQLQNRDSEILELNKEIATLKEELAMRKAPRSDLRMENENLKNIIEQYKRSVRSLDDEIEVHKLSQGAHEKRVQAEKQKSCELEKELNFIKSKYVKLLSEQFKITVPGSGGSGAGDEADLANQNKYNKELLALLKMEGGDNSLFEAYCSTFEDNYGDRYDWEGDTATQHYLCRLLYTHYQHQEQEKLQHEWEDYLAQSKHLKGTRDFLQIGGDKHKLRNLLRKGLPFDIRGHVWSSLVHQHVGKSKEVRDRATAKEETYYQSLLKNSSSSSSVKQIKLDLYRTLPSNRHFKSGGAGAEKLERVLLAYSLHNDKVGYCQGMNMIAAFGLLYLDEETSFWFLVMIIEKLMPTGYFTPGLLGAQADLAVVKRLVAEKLPRINAHLQEYFIDITLVTFNWFLTIFIDALPTESALRIIDCFLLEGHKILFRVALGLLKVNEQHILSLSDPVGLFQFLKEVARHAFDVEELFNAAFVQLNPFPRRNQLASWHHAGFVAAKEQWNVREKQREESEKKQQQQTLNLLTSIAPPTSNEAAPTARHLHWECGCGRGQNEVWLCCDEKGEGRLGVVSLDDKTRPHLEMTSCKVNPRIITLYYEPNTDLMFVGTLDFSLQVINCKTREVIWTHKFKDSVLDIVGTSSGKIIIAQADGNISMLKHVTESSLDDDPWQLHVGSNSVTTLVVSAEETVWCGAGKTVMVVSTEKFEPVQSFLASGKVNKMRNSHHGVWVSFRSSTILCLYDSLAYVKLLEVDYATLSPSPPLDSGKGSVISNNRVTSLLADGDMIYLGTGGGEVFQFQTVASVADPEASIKALVAERWKPKLRKRKLEREGSATVGGLLIKAEVGQEKDPQPPSGSRSSFYTGRNRKFGRTLRHGRPEGETTGSSPVSVYKLEFFAHKKLGSAVNEPVRVVLQIGRSTLACVNRVVEWDKCVAVLTSKEKGGVSDSEEWLVEYIPSPRQLSPNPQQRVSPTTDPEQALVTVSKTTVF